MLDKGTIVAGYRIDGVLGEGGMGTVYRATQLSLNRTVALKLLAAHLNEDPAFRERFRREGLLQAAIDHPHIVTVYEAGADAHGLFLAMRLVRGPTLKDIIRSRELEPIRGMRVLSQVADALDAAHEVGLTHRDVKPQNILIAARDHAYLADFGLTKAPDASSLTDTGQFIGTIDYVSPEQARGDEATARSDVYALTGVLYEALVGEVPYSRPSEPAVLYAHMVEPPPRVSEKRPELPARLDLVIARGMAKDPAERPASAGELMREAGAAFDGLVEERTAIKRRASISPAPAAGGRETVEAATPGAAPGETTSSPSATRPAAAPAAEAAPGVTAPPAAATSPAAAAPGRPARRLARGVPLVGLAVALTALAATAGFVVGGSGAEGEQKVTNSASAGPLALSFPTGWERTTEQPEIPGMRLSDPIVLVPPERPGSRLAAGLVNGAGETLLPPSFRARLSEAPTADDPVRLGRVDALRHAGLAPEGLDGTATVYAAPTTRGVAVVTCVAGRGARNFLPECERVAATLVLSGAKPYPLAPNEDYARLLTTTMRGLRVARATGARRLAAARGADAQAAAAEQLARAYRAAAQRLRGATVSPREREATSRIAAALGAIGATYVRAASAARDDDARAYAKARRSLRSGDAAARRALQSLSLLGYTIPR